MDCEKARELLIALLKALKDDDDSLANIPKEVRGKVTAHMSECTACNKWIENQKVN